MEPYCDSDEEIFWGPVTTKEIKKTVTLGRRTQIYETSPNKSVRGNVFDSCSIHKGYLKEDIQNWTFSGHHENKNDSESFLELSPENVKKCLSCPNISCNSPDAISCKATEDIILKNNLTKGLSIQASRRSRSVTSCCASELSILTTMDDALFDSQQSAREVLIAQMKEWELQHHKINENRLVKDLQKIHNESLQELSLADLDILDNIQDDLQMETELNVSDDRDGRLSRLGISKTIVVESREGTPIKSGDNDLVMKFSRLKSGELTLRQSTEANKFGFLEELNRRYSKVDEASVSDAGHLTPVKLFSSSGNQITSHYELETASQLSVDINELKCLSKLSLDILNCDETEDDDGYNVSGQANVDRADYSFISEAGDDSFCKSSTIDAPTTNRSYEKNVSPGAQSNSSYEELTGCTDKDQGFPFNLSEAASDSLNQQHPANFYCEAIIVESDKPTNKFSDSINLKNNDSLMICGAKESGSSANCTSATNNTSRHINQSSNQLNAHQSSSEPDDLLVNCSEDNELNILNTTYDPDHSSSCGVEYDVWEMSSHLEHVTGSFNRENINSISYEENNSTGKCDCLSIHVDDSNLITTEDAEGDNVCTGALVPSINSSLSNTCINIPHRVINSMSLSACELENGVTEASSDVSAIQRLSLANTKKTGDNYLLDESKSVPALSVEVIEVSKNVLNDSSVDQEGESCDEESTFNDTLEEVEMMMKYGLEYMLSDNDVNLKQHSLQGRISTPNRSITEMENLQEAFNSNSHQKIGNVSEGNKSRGTCKKSLGYPDVSNREDLEHSVDSLESSDSCIKSWQQVSRDICQTRTPQELLQSTEKVSSSEDTFIKPQVTLAGRTQNDSATKYKQSRIPSKSKICIPINMPSPFKVPTTPSLSSGRPARIAAGRQTKGGRSPGDKGHPWRGLNYDNVMSPVSAYINNSPSPVLVKNVTPRTWDMMAWGGVGVEDYVRTTQQVPNLVDKGEENVDPINLLPVLPEVSYRSVPTFTKEPEKMRMPRMNQRLKKLVDTPKPVVIRHEGRVRMSPMSVPPRAIHFDPDDSSALYNSANLEMSVVVNKQATRTHTLKH